MGGGGAEASGTADDVGPQLAVMGTFDVGSYADALYPRIFDLEIRRRCPTATVRAFAPLGWKHWTPLSGAGPAEPLGPPTDARRAEIARGHDVVAIGGGALLHDSAPAYAELYAGAPEDILQTRPWEWFIPADGGAEPATASPIVWNALGLPSGAGPRLADRIAKSLRSVAYATVRDERSAREVRRCAPDADVHVVPDTVLIVDRLFSSTLRARRARYLRALANYPPGSPLLIQAMAGAGEADGLGLADALVPVLAAQGERPIAVLDLPAGRAAQALAAQLSRRLERSVMRVRVSSVEDIAAAIGCAAVYIGSSLDAALTAIAYDVPTLLLDHAEALAVVGFAQLAGLTNAVVQPGAVSRSDLERVLSPLFRRRLAAARERLQSSIDRHFNTLAELALQAWERRSNGMALSRLMGCVSRLRDEAHALREAHQALTERLLEERLRFAELLGPEGGAEAVSAFLDLRERLDRLERTKAEPPGSEELVALQRELTQCRDELARLKLNAQRQGQ